MKRLTEEEANNLVLDKIPFEERMRSVYHPLFVIDCALYAIEDITTLLVEMQKSSTKKDCRKIKENVASYQRDNYRVMQSSLYNDIQERSKKFYEEIMLSLYIFQLQYQQQLLKRGICLTKDVEALIAKCFLARELLMFAQKLDKDFSNRMSELLGTTITYTTEENPYCGNIINALEGIIKTLGSPLDLHSSELDTCIKVFSNKVKEIRVW